jgi:hypothetical protein
VLLQAEQEVTAKLDTAAPLSRVCVNLLTLPGFAKVLWARLVARSGGWIIGKYVEKQARPERQRVPETQWHPERGRDAT